MNKYPKSILTIEQQIQSYYDSGMSIADEEKVRMALATIGYYRLRGYLYPSYDNAKKKYDRGCDFEKILSTYDFDMSFQQVLSGILSHIEVALRSHLTSAILQAYGDALVLYDPSIYKNKAKFWQNMGAISGEIARSQDAFIKHNYENHDGLIPVWAAVETLSFGTLSKIIKNLSTGGDCAFYYLSNDYRYLTKKGNLAKPSSDMLSSWTHSIVILRNLCAHNSRIYNRKIATKPVIIEIDKPALTSESGVYKVVLAMKYLHPGKEKWMEFVNALELLFQKYAAVIELSKLGFPEDWKSYLTNI